MGNSSSSSDCGFDKHDSGSSSTRDSDDSDYEPATYFDKCMAAGAYVDSLNSIPPTTDNGDITGHVMSDPFTTEDFVEACERADAAEKHCVEVCQKGIRKN